MEKPMIMQEVRRNFVDRRKVAGKEGTNPYDLLITFHSNKWPTKAFVEGMSFLQILCRPKNKVPEDLKAVVHQFSPAGIAKYDLETDIEEYPYVVTMLMWQRSSHFWYEHFSGNYGIKVIPLPDGYFVQPMPQISSPFKITTDREVKTMNFGENGVTLVDRPKLE